MRRLLKNVAIIGHGYWGQKIKNLFLKIKI